jgi:hypothetical protein
MLKRLGQAGSGVTTPDEPSAASDAGRRHPTMRPAAPGYAGQATGNLIGGKTMVGLTFAVLAVVVLGLVVVALGLALERLVRRHRAKPPPQA